MARTEVLTSVDIGTSKVACLIAEADSNGNIDFVGHGLSPCSGLKRGALIDPDATVRAIEAAVNDAEREAGYSVNNVLVSLTSEYVHSLSSHGVWAVSNPSGEISVNDVRRALDSARLVGIPSDREIIHVIPRGFTVDGHEGVRNPVGLSGLRLEVDTHIVAASSAYLQNLGRCLSRATLEVEDDGLIASSMASGLAVLTAEERKLGTAMIDIGAGTVDLSVFCDDEIGHSAILSMGGDLLTQDLARFFRIPASQAERLKLEKGIVAPTYLDSDEKDRDAETVNATSLSGEEQVTVSRFEMAQVLEARLLDILEWVGKEIESAESQGLVVTSLVLTGGGSQLPGLANLACRELDKPCRVAAPCYPERLPDQLASPIYSTAVGLILHGASRRLLPAETVVGVSSSKVKVLLGRVGRWLAEVF